MDDSDIPGPYLLSYSGGCVASLYEKTLWQAQYEAEDRCRNMQQAAHIVERGSYRVVSRVVRLSNGEWFAATI